MNHTKISALRHDARSLILPHGGADRDPFFGMGGRTLRAVTAVVIAALLNSSMLPLVHAAQNQRRHAAQKAASVPDNEARYALLLQDVAVGAQRSVNSTGRSTSVVTLTTLNGANNLQHLADALQAQWAEQRTQWIKAGVPQVVIDRHRAIEQSFQDRHQQTVALLQAASAQDATFAQKRALADFLQREQPRQPHLPINLTNMPWQVQKAVKAEPATDAQALEKKLHLHTSGNKAQATIAIGSTKTGNLKSASASTPADLAPTLDAPQTADIKALAQAQGNNPHKIYQWVHDNIHWQPTQGSVQGAQNTLDKKAGNATDTASLLIATLRAAGIPARYVYGSVDVPAEQMMNWVGGAKTIEAAQQVLGQGGIPNTALVSGGRVTSVRLEHVWVEALIQYQPGRGAKHVPGQSTPDSWVPMDASYKQYTFKPGMDLAAAVPLDTQALLNAAQQGAVSNEAEGWVQNLNTTALQSQLTAYQARLKTYINGQNGGSSTVGDVLGRRQASIDPLPYLAGTLPYEVQARSRQFSEIPDSLRTKFKYGIYPDALSASRGDTPLLSFEAPTAALAGKKLTLAWVAASPADQAAIEALIPGNLSDPSQLPRTIANAVHLKPQILVDGQIKAEGPGMGAGSEPVGKGGFTRYGTGQWDETQDQLIAGQQTALGLSIQGISQAQLNTLKARMEATKAKLEQAQAAPEAQRPTILKDVTGDMLTGDLLTATIWGYFASLQSHGAIASSQAQMFDAPALSYGLFHAQARPNKLFGQIITGVTFQGLNMDVGHLRDIRWVKDDNPQSPINNKPELTANGKTAAQNRWIGYNKLRGQYGSAMEHAVPEQFWVDKSNCRYTDENGQVKNPALVDCAEGISAVKAIAIAQQQRQKIYTINQSNAATALPKLTIGGDTGAEIRSAIQSGKEVTFHESPITAHGWTGYGYTIIDPDTGAGAYLIEGRGNGSVLLLNLYNLLIQFFAILVGAMDVMAGVIFSIIDALKNSITLLMNGCSPAIVFQAAAVSAIFALGFLLMAPGSAPIIIALLVGIFAAVVSSLVWSSFSNRCKAS